MHKILDLTAVAHLLLVEVVCALLVAPRLPACMIEGPRKSNSQSNTENKIAFVQGRHLI